MGCEDNQQKNEEEIENWPMAYVQTRINPGEVDAHNSLRFWQRNRAQNSDKKSRTFDN